MPSGYYTCIFFAWLSGQFTSTWHFRPSTPDIFWEDEGPWSRMSLQRLSKILLALHVWYRWQASILGALKIGWVNVKFAVFRREVPAPHGSNLVFPGPKWRNFTGMKGGYHCRPSTPGIFWEDEGLWSRMSLQRLSNMLLALHMSGTADTLPFWEH